MIFNNQIVTAQKLIEAFMGDDKHQYCVLLAQMQSGKSDTFMLVGCELVRLGLVERFIVFSGNAEIELREQAKDQRAFERSYRAYLTKEKKMTIEEAEDVCEMAMSEFAVLWSSDLAKHHTKGKTLYIWDESHYAQSSKQRPDKFFRKQGLQPNGSGSDNGNLLLSVSATPFSELLDNDEFVQKKKVVKMEPGSEYIGVDAMLKNDSIRGFSGNFRTTFASIVPELLNPDATRNVGLIRLTLRNEQDIRTICAQAGVSFLLYDQNWEGAPINELLKTHVGVIGLKGKVRMGKQIIKDNVAWCFETAVRSNTDTLLQGLIGRCCGYPSTGSSLDIKIYVPQKMIDSGVMRDYADMMNGEDVVPAPAMNVKNVSKDFYPTIPEKFEIPMDEWEGTQSDLQAFMRDFIMSDEFASKSANVKILNSRMKGNVLADLKDLIKKPGCFTFSDLTKESFKDHKNNMENAIKSKKVLRDPGSSCGVRADGSEVRIWSDGGKPKKGTSTWTVYIQFLTKVETIKATTSKREVFCRLTEDDMEVMDNGAIPLGLPIGSASDVTQMQASLIEAIETSNACENLVTGNKITSQSTNDDRLWQGIAVTNEVLKALMPKGNIYKHIFEMFEIKIKIKKARGRRAANFPEEFAARLTAIEW